MHSLPWNNTPQTWNRLTKTSELHYYTVTSGTWVHFLQNTILYQTLPKTFLICLKEQYSWTFFLICRLDIAGILLLGHKNPTINRFSLYVQQENVKISTGLNETDTDLGQTHFPLLECSTCSTLYFTWYLIFHLTWYLIFLL